MRFAVYPFASGADVQKNLGVMLRAMELAAHRAAGGAAASVHGSGYSAL